MSISFIQIPIGLKVPGVFVEFDTSKAQQGTAIQFYRALIITQKLAAGTKAAGQVDKVTSAAQAGDFYGKGSMAFHMVDSFIKENGGLNELNVISLDDLGGGTASTGTFEILTAPTAAGTLSIMIGGIRYQVGVVDTDTEAIIIAALVALINADPNRHVDVAINVTPDIMDITYRHKGLLGDDIDIRLNFFEGEEVPAGITSTIVPMSGGAGNPSLAAAITAMAEVQYHSIAVPFNDAANLLLMQTEMQDRWGPIRQNDGHVFYARQEDFSTFSTFLDTRNNEQETIMAMAGPTPSFQWAANMAAVVAQEGQRDPARPLQTLALTSLLAPTDPELFTFGERDLLLKAGGSTFSVDGSGIVRVERLRTTRVENEFAAPDEALADLNPKLTLSFIRFDFRVLMLTKYPRHKLANDGTRFGPGQAVITPKIGKAEAVNRFSLWEEQGLVEGIDQFKRDLIVERNGSDPNRLDFLLPTDLMNQLRVAGAQIGFLL